MEQITNELPDPYLAANAEVLNLENSPLVNRENIEPFFGIIGEEIRKFSDSDEQAEKALNSFKNLYLTIDKESIVETITKSLKFYESTPKSFFFLPSRDTGNFKSNQLFIRYAQEMYGSELRIKYLDEIHELDDESTLIIVDDVSYSKEQLSDLNRDISEVMPNIKLAFFLAASTDRAPDSLHNPPQHIFYRNKRIPYTKDILLDKDLEILSKALGVQTEDFPKIPPVIPEFKLADEVSLNRVFRRTFSGVNEIRILSEDPIRNYPDNILE